MRAEDVSFEGGENGWEMLVTTEDGFVRRYNIHGIAIDVLKNLNDTIGEWYREGLAAAAAPGPTVELATEENDYDLTRDLGRGR